MGKGNHNVIDFYKHAQVLAAATNVTPAAVALAKRYLSVRRRAATLRGAAGNLTTDELRAHAKPRFYRVPDRLNRCVLEERRLEPQIAAELMRAHQCIFMVLVDPRALVEAAGGIGESVVAGYTEEGGLLLDGRVSVPTLWGKGRGLCVLASADLFRLIPARGTSPLSIDCRRERWFGTCGTGRRAMQFRYYQQQQGGSHTRK
jgi:hypothetical protein